jgi:oxygen-independent coproporphyrinogen-3 oxidase
MGGGTPGILSAEEMADLLSLVKKEFDLSPLREFCVEMGRPDTITKEKLLVLKKAGVDRISINPQTTSDQTLLHIGRNHTAEEFFRAMELAKGMGFASINCDLIAGLEGEEPDDFLKSLREVLATSPEEITLHALCKKRSAEAEPEEKESRIWQDTMEKAHGICINAGLEPYYLYRQKNAAADLENTGFAKNGSIGVYNLAMMEDLCDIFACGAGGIGKLLPKEKGEKIRRFPSFKYPFEYLSKPEKAEERLREIERFL